MGEPHSPRNIITDNAMALTSGVSPTETLVDHGATQVAQGNFATSVAFDNPHFHSEHVSTDVGNDDNEHGRNLLVLQAIF